MKTTILYLMITVPLASPWMAGANDVAIDYATDNTEARPIVLAVKTGDDDDIDDTIVERAKKAVERKRDTSASGDAKETEDDLYVGNKPRSDNVAVQPTDKIPPPPVFDPAPAKRLPDLESTPVRSRALSDNAVGTLDPAAGKWHSFVTVKGPNFAAAERVMVLWYSNDDASGQQTSITATLRKRTGADEIEIEIPRDAGASSDSGVVRVYLFMPNQLQPVLAGRFTVNNVTAPAADSIPATPILITTPPLKMQGRRLPPEVIPTTPILITTPPLKMQGRRPAHEVIPTTPILITTPALKMQGKRPALYDAPPQKPGPIIDRRLRISP